MTERVTMPALGESVTEGTVTRWLKQVGDAVAVDEPLLEVSTDKVDTEIPSPVAGVLQEILVAEDETVPVGAALAVIGDPPADAAGGSTEPAAEPDLAPAEPEPAPAEPAPPEPAPAAPATAEPATAEPATAEPAPAKPGSGSDTTVTMPALGESVTEGTVTRWLKAVGDEVALDEPLLEVSTDKVDTEIPSPVAGTVRSILVAEDETVPVGADLVVIGSGVATAAAPSAPATDPAAQQPTLADEAEDQAQAHQQAAEDSSPAAPPEQVEEAKAAAEQQPAQQPTPSPAPTEGPLTPQPGRRRTRWPSCVPMA